MCREEWPDGEGVKVGQVNVESIIDHIRVMHPDQYEEPERWPDGSLVIYDDTLTPDDFQTAATPLGEEGVAAPHAAPDALSPRPGRLAAGGLGAPSAASRVRFVLACLGLYLGVPAAWVAFLVWLVIGR